MKNQMLLLLERYLLNNELDDEMNCFSSPLDSLHWAASDGFGARIEILRTELARLSSVASSGVCEGRTRIGGVDFCHVQGSLYSGRQIYSI